MNTTLSPVTVQRFVAVQGELIGLVELDYTGLTPKLEQIIRAFEFTQIELAVYRDRGYAQGRGVGLSPKKTVHDQFETASTINLKYRPRSR